MKITAILCNYNGGDYLRECIESVLKQERPVDEFIILDDGSTDRSRLIISEYTSLPRVRYIEHELNQGQAAGFNSAIEAATGDLLCFIDSDDVWFVSKTREFEHLALADADSVLFQHNLAVIDGEVQTEELYMDYMSWGDVWAMWNKSRIFFPTFSPTTGIAVRAAVAKAVMPIPTNLRHSADSFLTRSSITQGRVSTITYPLGGYRRHGANAVMGNTKHNSWRFFLKEVAPYLDEFYLRNALPSPIKKLNINRNVVDILLDLSLRGICRSIRARFF